MSPKFFALLLSAFYVNRYGVSHVEGFEGPGTVQVQRNEFPFSVAFINIRAFGDRASQYFCGGTLITHVHVLTSAHCLDDEDLLDIKVLIGHYNLISNLMKSYDISKYLNYHAWAKSKGKDSTKDLAVVTLCTAAKSVEPISISPIRVQRMEGLEVGMAAWGLSLNDIVSSVMEKAYARIISAERCEKINERYTSMEIKGQILQQQLLCSTADPRVLGTCGNSGSPVFDRKRRQLIGIHYGVCRKELPDHPDEANLLVAVAPFRKFINEAISG